MDKHDLIVALQSMAAELGRTPTHTEFTNSVRGGHYQIKKQFQNYTVLCQAAGLDTYRAAPKLTNAIFERDLERHLAEHKPEPIQARIKYPSIAVLGDLHEPFSHEQVKADFVSFVEKHRPKYVIQVGDSMDGYSHAKFPKSMNIYTPKQEEDLARKNLEELWKAITKASPQSKKILLLGNHCIRGIKRVLENVPSIEHWAQKYLQDLMSFDGVETVFDHTQEYFIEDIAFLHGHYSKIGDHRDYMLMNAVCGHVHLGGVSYRHIKGKTLWELNAGLAGDPYSKGLSYRNQKMTKWTLGWGFIDEYGPRFIPL